MTVRAKAHEPARTASASEDKVASDLAQDMAADLPETQDAPDTPEADLRVGRRIRAIRIERKLSLAEVAQRAGVSVGALSQIERGLTSLRVRMLWPLAAALEVEPHSLIS